MKHADITGHSERETRAVWGLYRSLVGKPLKDATRDDGRKLVEHFESQGLRSAAIQKKITWLNAAVNLAIKETELNFNPFSGAVPKRNDKQKRLPLDEADIRNAKRNLDRLDESNQWLFRLLAATGMRLSEAFEIDGEMKERGCRYVIVGSLIAAKASCTRASASRSLSGRRERSVDLRGAYDAHPVSGIHWRSYRLAHIAEHDPAAAKRIVPPSARASSRAAIPGSRYIDILS